MEVHVIVQLAVSKKLNYMFLYLYIMQPMFSVIIVIFYLFIKRHFVTYLGNRHDTDSRNVR